MSENASSANRSSAWKTFRLLWRNRLAAMGSIIILLLLFFTLAGPALSPHDPIGIDMSARLHPPSLRHPFGTDDFGRDVLSRVLSGASISLKVGIIAVGISMFAGTLLGRSAGTTEAGSMR